MALAVQVGIVEADGDILDRHRKDLLDDFLRCHDSPVRSVILSRSCTLSRQGFFFRRLLQFHRRFVLPSGIRLAGVRAFFP
ncbi:hypothetical protein D3C77_597990 [compost metagenome]